MGFIINKGEMENLFF